jgi:glycosyltransferase involved in cell wall biosynthesis
MYLMPPALVPRPRSTYQRFGRWYRRLVVPIIAKRADAIATDSYDSACGIERYVGIGRDRIAIIHAAPADEFRRLENPCAIQDVRRRYGIEGKFILALGGVDPRKNTPRVIEAFAGLRSHSGAPLELVIVGMPQKGRTLAGSLSKLGPEQRVTFAGFVSDETLVALYNAAEALLYPSIYEGFGLPVLEAMACGTPVVCSRAGSLPEVAGDAALYVDPWSECDITRALLELSTHEPLRELLARRGLRQARKFSWSRSAKQTLELYEACLAA